MSLAVEERGLVHNGRVGVGHGADQRDATRERGRRSRAEILLVDGSRLPWHFKKSQAFNGIVQRKQQGSKTDSNKIQISNRR
jgi:hypothetical protein